MATVGAREREERESREAEAYQLKCLREKNFNAVVSMLQARNSKAKPDLRDPDFGWTPLLFAADGGAVQLINVLVNSRAKLEAACEEGNTALCAAARQGHCQVVQLLSARKANLGAKNRGGWTPLLWAAMNGHGRAVAALLDVKASCQVADALGRTALMWAARHGHTAVAETLLERGADFTRRDEDGLTAADHAQEHFELRASLVLAEERSRRLLDAAQRNDVEAARQALEAGACVDVPDDEGWSPLAWAMLMESRPLVEVLVQHGANPNLLGEEAALGEQIVSKHSAVNEALRQVLAANGRLMEAARSGKWSEVGSELGLGAWINIADERGCTPLMMAAKQGAEKGTALLARKGANVNAQDAEGWTALLYGAISRSLEVVCILYHYKADLNIKSFHGHSALHLAVSVKDAAMVQILLAGGVDMNEKDYQNRTPLHSAAANAACIVLQTLLFYRADADARDHEMRTPLALAVVEEQYTACQAMLSDLQPPPEPALPPEENGSDEERDGPESPPGAIPEEPEEPEDATPVASPSRTQHRFSSPDVHGQPPRRRSLDSPKSLHSPKRLQGQPRQLSLDTGTAQLSSTWSAGLPGPSPGGSSDASDPRPGQPNLGRRRSSGELQRTSTSSSMTSTLTATPKARGRSSASSSPPRKGGSSLPARQRGPLGLLAAASEWRQARLLSDYLDEAPGKAALLKVDDDHGREPLQLAARASSRSIVELVLQTQVADIRATDMTKTNALMEAARGGDPEVVELLLAAAADVNHRNKEGKLAGDFASNEAVRELLEKAAVNKRMPRKLFGAKPEAGPGDPKQEQASSTTAIFRVRLEQLPRQIEGDLLRRHVRRILREIGAGRPLSVDVVLDPITEKPKGIAYADFGDAGAAEAALRGDGEELLKHTIRVRRDLPPAMVR